MHSTQDFYSEETLELLKDIRKDINSGALDRMAIGKIMQNVHTIRGDDGQDGVGIKSIESEHSADDIIVKFIKTDDSVVQLVFPRLKGIDGINGKDGVPGTNGRDGIDGKDGERGPRGERGPAGKNGANGKDGKGVNWRGEWNINETYRVNDAVEYLGSSYIAIRDSRGNSTYRSDYWNLMAQKGRDGAAASQDTPAGISGQESSASFDEAANGPGLLSITNEAGGDAGVILVDSDGFKTTLKMGSPSADRVLDLPDTSGKLISEATAIALSIAL